MSDYSNSWTKGTGDTVEVADFTTEWSALETAIASKIDDGSVITKHSTGAQATTSGTSKEYTAIPSTVKRLTLMGDSVSVDAIGSLAIQIGDGSGGYVTTGYSGRALAVSNAAATSASTSGIGFLITLNTPAATNNNFVAQIINITGNSWICTAQSSEIVDDTGVFYVGRIDLTAALDRVKLLELGGATFDNGQINLIYEG